MLRLVLVGLAAGVVFIILDGVVNANPLARELYAPYKAIARPRVNAVAGSVVDLVYGVVLVLLFSTLRVSLPGQSNLAKALSFGVMVWFLRVCMRVAGEWVMTAVPARAHAYTLVAGLVQILIVAYIIGSLVPATEAGRT